MNVEPVYDRNLPLMGDFIAPLRRVQYTYKKQCLCLDKNLFKTECIPGLSSVQVLVHPGIKKSE